MRRCVNPSCPGLWSVCLIDMKWLVSLACVTDEDVREAFNCALMNQNPAQRLDVDMSTPAMQCEEHQERMNVGIFLLGVLLNCYCCWIVHSYETTVRGRPAAGGGGGISDESPA